MSATRSWISCPPVNNLGLMLIASLLLQACSCDDQRQQAKAKAAQRVSAPVTASPVKIAATQKIAVDSLHRDRKLLDRVWRMPWREARLRLSTHHVWQASAKLAYSKVGGAGLSLYEEAELRYQQGSEALDLSVSNDGGFFQRIVFSNGMLYRKYQNGDYVASKDLDSKRLFHADEAFALGNSAWDLIGRLIALKPTSSQNVAGRPVACYEIRKAAAPAAFEGGSLKGILKSLKGWRSSLSLKSVEGLFCVDKKHGVPLRIQIKALAERSFEGGTGELNLDLKSEFQSLGKAPSIQAPEDFLTSLRRKRRKRPASEFLKKEGLVLVPSGDAGTATQVDLDSKAEGRAVGRR